jgi:hypothetical protein
LILKNLKIDKELLLMGMDTKKEKGKKHDGISRVSNDLYRQRWEEVFGQKGVVITEASFTSREYENNNEDK